jgi:DNA-binding transcriptional LysR family regulator
MPLSDRIGRRIRLHDLHVLMTVVQAGSMNKAAALLNTGQSAVSRSVSDLEHAIGVRLLDRTPRGVEPTQYGRTLLAGGVAAFDDLRQAVRSIEFLADPTAGEVRIGTVLPLAASFVHAVVDRLSRRHPRIVCHFTIGQQHALHRELRDRNLDLLVAWRRDPDPDNRSEFEFLYDDAYAVVAGLQNPWARRRRVDLADLVGERWTLPPTDTVLGRAVMEAFRACGLECPRATAVVLPEAVRLKLLTTGRFLSIFTSSALKLSDEGRKLKVLPVKLPLDRLPVGLVTLKNRTLSPVAQLFADGARDVARTLTNDTKIPFRTQRRLVRES